MHPHPATLTQVLPFSLKLDGFHQSIMVGLSNQRDTCLEIFEHKDPLKEIAYRMLLSCQLICNVIVITQDEEQVYNPA